MEKREEPLFDQTPWGKDEHWDREYVSKLVDRWQEGVNEAMTILEITSLPQGARVLDLGCGIGRHALTFAKAGLEVVGLDLNGIAIKRAQELSRSKKLDGTFLQQDFRSIEYQGEFELVLFLDSSFGLFTEEENRKMLEQSLRALTTGGFLIIESYNREFVVERMGTKKGLGRNWQEKDGRLLSNMATFDLVRSRYNWWSEYMVLKTGEKVSEPVRSLRLYTLCELALLFGSHGAALHSFYGGYDCSDYTIASEKMIVLARKG
jgi:SAM-dependent methyltransferase